MVGGHVPQLGEVAEREVPCGLLSGRGSSHAAGQSSAAAAGGRGRGGGGSSGPAGTARRFWPCCLPVMHLGMICVRHAVVGDVE